LVQKWDRARYAGETTVDLTVPSHSSVERKLWMYLQRTGSTHDLYTIAILRALRGKVQYILHSGNISSLYHMFINLSIISQGKQIVYSCHQMQQ